MMDFFDALWRDLGSVFSERIELGTNPVTTLNIIVWSLFIGFIIAIGVTLYNKIVLGKLVRTLIEKHVTSPECALTLENVGAKNPLIMLALRRGSSLRRVVHLVENSNETDTKENIANGKFYIPNECMHRASKVYDKPETSVFSVLLAIIAFLVIAMVAFIAIPDIVQLISNIGNLK